MLTWCAHPYAGIALRVPTPNVSVVDLVVQVEKKTFAEEVRSHAPAPLGSDRAQAPMPKD